MHASSREIKRFKIHSDRLKKPKLKEELGQSDENAKRIGEAAETFGISK